MENKFIFKSRRVKNRVRKINKYLREKYVINDKEKFIYCDNGVNFDDFTTLFRDYTIVKKCVNFSLNDNTITNTFYKHFKCRPDNIYYHNNIFCHNNIYHHNAWEFLTNTDIFEYETPS